MFELILPLGVGRGTGGTKPGHADATVPSYVCFIEGFTCQMTVAFILLISDIISYNSRVCATLPNIFPLTHRSLKLLGTSWGGGGAMFAPTPGHIFIFSLNHDNTNSAKVLKCPYFFRFARLPRLPPAPKKK